MTDSLLLLVTIGALCAVTGWLLAMMFLRPKPKADEAVELHTRHGQEMLQGTGTRMLPGDDTQHYGDLFEQFERAVLDAEYGFERRRSARELLVAIELSDSTTLIAPEEAYDVDTITRAELLELRARSEDQ